MCEHFSTGPDDPRIIDMDPVQKFWFYEHWLGNHRDEAELAKNHAYLLGSFSNPEAVQKMLNPNVHESSDEDFEESSNMVRDTNLALALNQTADKGKKRKKRKAKLIQG